MNEAIVEPGVALGATTEEETFEALYRKRHRFDPRAAPRRRGCSASRATPHSTSYAIASGGRHSRAIPLALLALVVGLCARAIRSRRRESALG